MNIHKNARLTPQGRLLLVRRVDEQRLADAGGGELRPASRSGRAIAGWRATAADGAAALC